MQWSPRPAGTVALVLVGIGLGLGVALVDAPGRVLVGAAALLLLGLAIRDVVARPRLSAGPDGVVVRTGATRRRLRWEGLRIRARDVRRFGIRGTTLELDTASGSDDEGLLVVLGRWDLGDDPGRVAGALERLRPEV